MYENVHVRKKKVLEGCSGNVSGNRSSLHRSNVGSLHSPLDCPQGIWYFVFGIWTALKVDRTWS